MQVLKFGGSSVAAAENIQKAGAIVSDALQKERTIVVVSALGGITDQLLQCGNDAASGSSGYKEMIQDICQRHIALVKALIPVQEQSSLLSQVMQRCHEIEDVCNGIHVLQEFSARIRDRLLGYGELLSSQIISAYFCSRDLDNRWKDSRELIRTDSNFTAAVVDMKQTTEIAHNFFRATNDRLFVLPGFIASDASGNTTTLGRGGSDYTAAVLGAAVDASVVEIWTDVSGMMTADPRLVPNAKVIEKLSYQEAMELSHFGAKVIYPPTLQPLMQKRIPVWIKNTFLPAEKGTVITAGAPATGNIISGISSINHIALLSLEGSGMVGIPGFSKRLFEALAAGNINVILITQASSEHSICVGVEAQHAQKAKAVVDKTFAFEIAGGKVNPLVVETNLAVVALVGDKMKSHVGVSGKMFAALGRNGVNIRAIAQGSSERNISAVIAVEDVRKALNVLHEAFFETTFKQVNLFIAGTGNVGGRLLAQMNQQMRYLQQQLRMQVRVTGMANSRKMLFDDEGIDLANWKEKLAHGEQMDMKTFFNRIQAKNLRNSIFIDVTANDRLPQFYRDLLRKSISVVACNKIACSSAYEQYLELTQLAREFNASFLFETNVGAGLPVIGTLNDLVRSGDSITRIEAVLSGTLNFVFNHYDGKKSFASIVKQAQDEGYTEPDPRLDLSGTDVVRKIMILARESGARLEMEDISNESFMPSSCMEGTVDDFYREMEKEEPHFRKIFEAASRDGKKLKFVARYENGSAAVGLKHIHPEHDFYHLYGKDNIVLFYTKRYPEQPMVVKGAGAGAEVTASGVFADIMRAARV